MCVYIEAVLEKVALGLVEWLLGNIFFLQSTLNLQFFCDYNLLLFKILFNESKLFFY